MSYPSLSYKKGGFKISGPCKAAARRKFDVYPSAYANAWGVRCTKKGGPSKMGTKKAQDGMFEMSKEEQDKAKVDVIKGTRTKTEQRRADRDERRVDRKIKRYTGKAIRKSDRKNPEAGAAQRGLNMYQDKLQKKATRKRRRKARRQKVTGFGRKVAAGVKGRMTARRNRRRLGKSSGSGCQGAGCGAYE